MGAGVRPGLALVLAPLDAARRELWRVGARTALGRRCVQDRHTRLCVLAVAHIGVAFVLAGAAPLWLLLLGPLLLGVPHIVSDVRYLVVRRPAGLSRGALVAIGAPLLAMTALRIVAVAGGPVFFDVELALGAAALAGGIALSGGSWPVRAGGVAVVVGAAAVGLGQPYASALVIGHAHNFIAFALWVVLAWRGATRRQLTLVVAVFVAATAAILAGALDGAAGAALDGDAAGLAGASVRDALAPGFDAVWGLRLIILFAFAQAVHYTVWLRLVPQRMAAREAPPSFRRSVRDLRGDFGRWGLVVIVVASLLVPAAGLADAEGARHSYLMVALFHGWLEIAVLGSLLAGRAGGARPTPQGGVAW